MVVDLIFSTRGRNNVPTLLLALVIKHYYDDHDQSPFFLFLCIPSLRAGDKKYVH